MSWTQQQIDFLVNNYQELTSRQIAEQLGFSKSKVRNKIWKLGLKIDKSKASAERLGRYKKGNVPSNFGKKMPEHVYEKVKKTMFKKGNEPHNTRKNFELSERDGYTYIRIEKSKWVLYQRYLYEKEFGKIPENHIIIFKDKNTKNFELDNLQCISREENMHRNTIRNYPPEVVELIKLNSKIKKLIKDE